MFKASRLAGLLALLVGTASYGCAGQTNPATAPVAGLSGPGWIYQQGVLYHQPHYALAQPSKARIVPLIPYTPYQGGLVILSPKFYLIFWGYKKYGDKDKLEPLLLAYTKAMGGSGHNNIETQYYEKLSGKTNYITNPAKQFGGSWDDESPVPKKPSDANVAAESLRGVNHFGYDPNGVYVVMTPHGRSEAGFGNVWCSYHSDTVSGKNKIPYANLPYMTDATVGLKCGMNIIAAPKDESGRDEGMTILAGHEYGEVITDPFPFSGWTGENGEIADPCQWHDIANDPFGKKSYTMQPMVSDATQSCVQSYP